MDISEEHFILALDVARTCYLNETQFELNLAGIGESTLHPQFPEFITMAREKLPGARLTFATNGLNLSWLHESHPAHSNPLVAASAKNAAQRIINALVEAKKTGAIEVWVSLHRPERAALAVEVLKRYGLLSGVSADPSINADDWAGQVKWHRTHQVQLTCQWLRDKKVFVMADGRVTTCCLDASGAGVIGHVQDDPDTWQPKPYSLCKSCQYVLPKGMAV